MKFYIISDTHYNHDKIATYCDRPANFTELIVRNCQNTIRPEDIVIHVGDVFLGKVDGWDEIRKELPGTWWLIRGNHDDQRSPSWWCKHGFAACVDAMVFRGAWITHKPSDILPQGCHINIHGHLHNIWNGFHSNDPGKNVEDLLISESGKLKHAYQRLFAVEYTKFMPIEFDKFVAHPDRYNSRGPKGLL